MSFNVSTSGIAPGTYTHGIRAGTSVSTDSITIEDLSRTCVEDGVSGGDDQIDLSEIQAAISWWEGGTEVPGTGGETISLRQIQTLTDAWAPGTTVSCGATWTTCVQEAVSGADGKISLTETQKAINMWAEGAEVPGTGGETISLTEIQRIINAWAARATVSC